MFKNQKYIIFIILLQVVTSIKAQTLGIIKYKVHLSENSLFDEETLKKDETGSMVMADSALKLYANEFSFSLYFNKDTALFKAEKQMVLDKTNFKFEIAKTLLKYDDVYFLNIKDNIQLTQLNAFDQKFIIRDSISSRKWDLTKESKIIEGYICYKATFKKIVINNQGTFYKTVIAWYCPQLNYNFGPIGYGGLPGLILALKDDKFIYYAYNIDFLKNEKMKIEKPKRGKLVSKQEFQAIFMNTNPQFSKH